MEIVLAIAFFVFLFFKPRETFKYFILPVAVFSTVGAILLGGYAWREGQKQEAGRTAQAKIDAEVGFVPDWDKDPVSAPETHNFFDQFDKPDSAWNRWVETVSQERKNKCAPILSRAERITEHMSREYEKCMGAPQGVHLFD